MLDLFPKKIVPDGNNRMELYGNSPGLALTTSILWITSFYLSPEDIRNARLVCKRWHETVEAWHKLHWQSMLNSLSRFELEPFLRYFANSNWQDLCYKLQQIIQRLKTGKPQKKSFCHLLAPVVAERFDFPFYGSLAISPNLELILWFNGQVIQCADLTSSKCVWMTTISEVESPACPPALLCSYDKVFLHIEGVVLVYNLENGKLIRVLKFASAANHEDIRGIRISIRNAKIFLFGVTCIDVYDFELSFLFTIRHLKSSTLPDCNDRISLSFAGFQCPLWNARKHSSETEALKLDCKCSSNPTFLHHYLHLHTWIPRRDKAVQVWNMDAGEQLWKLGSRNMEIVTTSSAHSSVECYNYFSAILYQDGAIYLWATSPSCLVCITALSTGLYQPLSLSFARANLMVMTEHATHGSVTVVYKLNLNYIKQILVLRKNFECCPNPNQAIFSGWNSYDKSAISDLNSKNSFKDRMCSSSAEQVATCFLDFNDCCYRGKCYFKSCMQAIDFPDFREKIEDMYIGIPTLNPGDTVNPISLSKISSVMDSNESLPIEEVVAFILPRTSFKAEFWFPSSTIFGVWVSNAVPGKRFDECFAFLQVFDLNSTSRLQLYPSLQSIQHDTGLSLPVVSNKDAPFPRGMKQRAEPTFALRVRPDVSCLTNLIRVSVGSEGCVTIYDFSSS